MTLAVVVSATPPDPVDPIDPEEPCRSGGPCGPGAASEADVLTDVPEEPDASGGDQVLSEVSAVGRALAITGGALLVPFWFGLIVLALGAGVLRKVRSRR